LNFDPDFFAKGLVIGFAIAVPVGPIGVLCIRRTLLNGAVSGLASGMGAALADASYGAVAAFGLTALSGFMQHYAPWIQGAGGFFLLYLGLSTLLKKPRSAAEISDAQRHLHGLREVARDFASTFLLTLTNPATILSFIAIFAGIGLVTAEGKPDYALSASMVAGVFAGSLVWWCVLAGGIGLLRHRLDAKALRLTNFVSGIILSGFGGVVLAHLAYSRF
jgi:threonine/homoserine/homoserine lactone efflux protein